MTRLLVLGFAAGALGAVGGARLAGEAAALVRSRAPRLAAGAAALVDIVLRAGREGRDPGARERRRLLAAGALAAFVAGWLVLGLVPAIGVGAVGPLAVSRVLRSGRERYRHAVDRGAASMAGVLDRDLVLLAGALVLGGDGKDAVHVHVERDLDLGHAARCGRDALEVERAKQAIVASELALGARTEDALEAMRARVRSHGVDTIVAASLLQRGAGGDLAGLLRECARALEDHARLEHDARAATAQARFTGVIVVLLPLGGALLAELASPGYLAHLAGSFLTAWLGGLALVMQLVAAVLIRRLGRVRV